MVKLKLPFKPLNFKEDVHKYFDDDGVEYSSVTTLIHTDFNGAMIAARCVKSPNSKYYGRTVQDVLEEWENAAPLGTVAHKAIEDYINDGVMPEDENAGIVKQFAKLKFTGTLMSEIVVYDKEYLIAGTADILEICDDVIWLWDIKTARSRPKGDRVANDKLKKYSLQLEIYRRLIEKCFKKKCKIGGIIWLKDYSQHLENTELKVFSVNEVRKDVDYILYERKMAIS